MLAWNNRDQAVDIVILHDMNQDYKIILQGALVVTQMQAMKKEYQLGLENYLMRKKNLISTSNRLRTR